MIIEPIHFWKSEYYLPVLWVDPCPSLGFYENARAMYGMMPRPVKWFPGNWITVPIIIAIELVKIAWRAK